MSEENNELETWEEVIVDFFEKRVENIKSGQKCNLYKARAYIDKKDEEIKSEKDTKKRERLVNNRDKKTDELADLRKKSRSDEIRQWVDITSNKNIAEGKRILKVTHALRFTHSSSESGGILLNNRAEDKLLTTSSLKKQFKYDMAHNNGSLVTVSRFLALKLKGEHIYDCILKDDFEFLSPFKKNKEQLEQWKKGYSDLIEERELKTTDKAKQMYFPLSKEVKLDADGNIDDNNYHLITPLFSSSLAEELYSLQIDLKYGEEQTSVKQANKGNASDPGSGSRYHSQSLIEFPRLAVQKFGGAQPQNVSMLNKNRGGRSYLLSTQSPIWQSQLQPPIKQKSLFGHGFYLPGTKEDIDYLREYLLRFERVALSIKNPERFKWIERWLGKITDEFLTYIASIQKLPAGWSSMEDITLKSEHQYLLDPFRADSEFQSARKVSDWQNTVCNDFGWWLNNRLRGKDKKFTPQAEHRRMWAKLLESPLRQHNELVESERKRKAGVGA